MPIARFGTLPKVSSHSLFLKTGKSLKSFRKEYGNLPEAVKKLLSFNTGEIFCRYGFGLAGFTENLILVSGKPWVTLVFPRNEDVKNLIRILIHELSHTLDPCLEKEYSGFILPKNYFPNWLYGAAKFEKWKRTLKEEPRSTDSMPDASKEFRDWMRKPCEQWACRCALTITVDYLAPAGVIGVEDIVVGKILSAAEFKAKWPKSYGYFHQYVQNILAHAPK